MSNIAIYCEKVSSNNLSLAIKTQNAIFPKENGALNLKASADTKFVEEVYGKNYRKSVDFWICKNENGETMGITGIYVYVEYPEDAWCGWFGIVPEKQRMGYGKKLFQWTIEKAREMGFKNFRLYTGLVENDIAVELYRKVGMVEEKYVAEDMKDEKIVIFSKSLTAKDPEKFGSKMLFLKKQEEIQRRAKELALKLGR